MQVAIFGCPCGGTFMLSTRSAMRPPTPVAEYPVDALVIHVLTWSECENKLPGRAFDLLVYSAVVSGTARGPTFATIASFPWSQSHGSPSLRNCEGSVTLFLPTFGWNASVRPP